MCVFNFGMVTDFQEEWKQEPRNHMWPLLSSSQGSSWNTPSDQEAEPGARHRSHCGQNLCKSSCLSPPVPSLEAPLSPWWPLIPQPGSVNCLISRALGPSLVMADSLWVSMTPQSYFTHSSPQFHLCISCIHFSITSKIERHV